MCDMTDDTKVLGQDTAISLSPKNKSIQAFIKKAV